MKKHIKKSTIWIVIATVVLTGFFILGLQIVKYFKGNYIEVILPSRNNSAPQNIDTTTEVSVAKLRTNYGFITEGFCEKQADELRGKILNSPNTEEIYKIEGTRYYISSSEGDDNNDGLSPETPFKTIQGVNKVWPKEGDAVLFKRGDTFRFAEPIVTSNTFIYGSYGEGIKPKIYGSPENYAKSDKWKKHKDNIWKIPFDYNEAGGLVLNHSELVGIKKESLSEMENLGDYYHDYTNGVFYLYCDKGNPSTAYHDIEIMPAFSLFEALHDSTGIVIDNLCLKYTAGFAIHAVAANNFTVTNCEIGFTGGKWTNAHERKLRYGNAIEFWEGAEDIRVENNWIYQTFDSALTWQGKIGSNYENISFSGNLFEYNNCDIEFFENDATLKNFTIKNNIMRFTSMGWGTRRNDGGIRGIEGCIRGVTGSHPQNKPVKIVSVNFTDNIIDCPARQIINWSWEPEQSEVIHTSGTKIYVKEEYRSMRKCLQGLQTKKGQSYYKRSASNFKDLKNDIKVFEQKAEVFWEEK